MENFRRSLNSTKAIAVVLLIALLAACTPAPKADDPGFTQISEGKLKPGSTVPVPADKTILTVTGKIGTTNSGSSIVMDLPTIESLRQIEYKANDPFEKKEFTFRGVLFSELLDLWQVDKSATVLKISALDDYSVELPIETVRKFPLMFALKKDGEYLPLATRGPARIIFPNEKFPFDSKYDSQWAWQIKAIEVK
jgi:hypothetical protein